MSFVISPSSPSLVALGEEEGLDEHRLWTVYAFCLANSALISARAFAIASFDENSPLK